MPTNAQEYFDCLSAYLNIKDYSVPFEADGRILLSEPIYLPDATSPTQKNIRLKFKGEVIVFKLDKNGDPLFHFFIDKAKPWAKKCDYVIFQNYKNKIEVYCIEFKSSKIPDTVVDQLRASESWCRSVHSIIKHYTSDHRRLILRKFVFSCNPDPRQLLDGDNKYLNRDHTIRHYHYDDLENLELEDLENKNIREIR